MEGSLRLAVLAQEFTSLYGASYFRHILFWVIMSQTLTVKPGKQFHRLELKTCPFCPIFVFSDRTCLCLCPVFTYVLRNIINRLRHDFSITEDKSIYAVFLRAEGKLAADLVRNYDPSVRMTTPFPNADHFSNAVSPCTINESK